MISRRQRTSRKLAFEFSADTLDNALTQPPETNFEGIMQVITKETWSSGDDPTGESFSWYFGYLYPMNDGTAVPDVGGDQNDGVPKGRIHVALSRGDLVDPANTVSFTFKFAAEPNGTDPSF
jgi:hypothetical protein